MYEHIRIRTYVRTSVRSRYTIAHTEFLLHWDAVTNAVSFHGRFFQTACGTTRTRTYAHMGGRFNIYSRIDDISNYLEISLNHLEISLNHLKISLNELEISQI